jgi:putative inorganic carbon (HCO3(-)) transporter
MMRPVLAAMKSPAIVLQRWVPEIDSRAWIMVALAGVLAAFFLKEARLPMPLLFAGGAALAVVWRGQSEIPLYVLTAYLPFSAMVPGRLFGLTGSVFVVGWLLATYLAHCHAVRRPLVELTPFHIVSALFIGLGLVSLARAGWLYGGWYAMEQTESLLRWLLPAVLGVVAYGVVRDRRTLYTVVALMMVTVAIVALVTIYEGWEHAGESFYRSRARGIAGQANILGSFFSSYMFLFLGFFLTFPRHRVRGWLPMLGFLLSGRAIMFTFSRGAYLGLVAGGLVACWFRHKLLFLAAVAVGAFVLTHPQVLPAGIRYRLEMTTVDHKMDLSHPPQARRLEKSVSTRMEIWEGAVKMIQAHPWWGMGYGAFESFIAHYTGGRITNMNAHNTFLMIAAELGLPALAVFLSLLTLAVGWAAWLYRRAQDPVMRAIALGVVAGVAGMVVANQFTVCLRTPEVAGYLWLLCGLMARAVQIERDALRAPA